MEYKNSVIVDSSFLISLFLENDSNHKNAIFLMEEIMKIERTLLLFERIIEETATVLLYKEGKKGLDIFSRFLEQQAFLEILENNHSLEWSHFLALDKKISFIDSILIFYSKKWETGILTFDKEILKISKQK